MTREEFYKTDRKERNYYLTTEDENVYLPLTNDGFEALLEIAAKQYDLLVDNRLRSLLAGYIHHIPSDEITMDFDKMTKVLYKSYSNSMTYEIDQKAKKEELDKFQKENPPKEPTNVLPILG